MGILFGRMNAWAKITLALLSRTHAHHRSGGYSSDSTFYLTRTILWRKPPLSLLLNISEYTGVSLPPVSFFCMYTAERFLQYSYMKYKLRLLTEFLPLYSPRALAGGNPIRHQSKHSIYTFSIPRTQHGRKFNYLPGKYIYWVNLSMKSNQLFIKRGNLYQERCL